MKISYFQNASFYVEIILFFFCLFFYNKDYNFFIILTNEFQNPFHMFCLQNFNICSKNWSEEFNLISKKKEKNI